MKYDYLFPQGDIGEIQQTVDELADKGWQMVGGLTYTGEDGCGNSFYICTMRKEVEWAAPDELNKLKVERDELQRKLSAIESELSDLKSDALFVFQDSIRIRRERDEWKAECQASGEEIRRYRDALKPFADYYTDEVLNVEGTMETMPEFKIQVFKDAKAAMEGAE